MAPQTGPFWRNRMGTPDPGYPLDLVALDREAATPLNRQICDQLRDLILGGVVPPGARLPSIRGLAAALGVSRNTVIAALDQLAAEGLAQSRQGSGIAGFLRTMRRVHCTPEQVVVTTGGKAALDLLARLLLDPGDTVWMEEPGYTGARGAFLAAGARLVPLPVSRAGWRAPGDGPPPRLIYLTPSCQHPLGVTMPLDQRFAILGLARDAGAWIVEDDFDGEYTFRGQPQPAMQGLTGDARVIYVDSFAKTLFPAMRLGFVVVPPDLAARIRPALSVTGQFAPLVLQAALAEFIDRGFFLRHLNRMRRLYARRRATFVPLFAEHLGPWLEPIDERRGIQIASTFRVPRDDRAIVAACHAAGVNLAPLSLYFAGPLAATGLLMGYAAVAEPAMRKALLTVRGIVAAAEG
jgi:GntR family transcriptional regulator/MocR family aminotransferase